MMQTYCVINRWEGTEEQNLASQPIDNSLTKELMEDNEDIGNLIVGYSRLSINEDLLSFNISTNDCEEEDSYKNLLRTYNTLNEKYSVFYGSIAI